MNVFFMQPSTAAIFGGLLGSPYATVETVAGFYCDTVSGCGHANGVGTFAGFAGPIGLEYDSTNGVLYVADNYNNLIRKIVASSDAVSVFAGGGSQGGTIAGSSDGVGTFAMFAYPYGLALDSSNGVLFVADSGNGLVRRIITNTNTVTTLAGSNYASAVNGVGTLATFASPTGLALDRAIGVLYVAEFGRNLIRKIIVSTASVTTLAGGGGPSGNADGVGRFASFDGPYGLAYDSSNKVLFVSDFSNNLIRRIVTSTCAVTTLAGGGTTGGIEYGDADGVGTFALFSNPFGLAYNSFDDVLYVADGDNNKLRSIAVGTVTVTTLVGDGLTGHADGVGTSATFFIPWGLAFDINTGVLFVSDTFNNLIRRVVAIDALTFAVSAADYCSRFVLRHKE